MDMMFLDGIKFSCGRILKTVWQNIRSLYVIYTDPKRDLYYVDNMEMLCRYLTEFGFMYFEQMNKKVSIISVEIIEIEMKNSKKLLRRLVMSTREIMSPHNQSAMVMYLEQLGFDLRNRMSKKKDMGDPNSNILPLRCQCNRDDIVWTSNTQVEVGEDD